MTSYAWGAAILLSRGRTSFHWRYWLSQTYEWFIDAEGSLVGLCVEYGGEAAP